MFRSVPFSLLFQSSTHTQSGEISASSSKRELINSQKCKHHKLPDSNQIKNHKTGVTIKDEENLFIHFRISDEEENRKKKNWNFPRLMFSFLLWFQFRFVSVVWVTPAADALRLRRWGVYIYLFVFDLRLVAHTHFRAFIRRGQEIARIWCWAIYSRSDCDSHIFLICSALWSHIRINSFS